MLTLISAPEPGPDYAQLPRTGLANIRLMSRDLNRICQECFYEHFSLYPDIERPFACLRELALLAPDALNFIKCLRVASHPDHMERDEGLFRCWGIEEEVEVRLANTTHTQIETNDDSYRKACIIALEDRVRLLGEVIRQTICKLRRGQLHSFV